MYHKQQEIIFIIKSIYTTIYKCAGFLPLQKNSSLSTPNLPL